MTSLQAELPAVSNDRRTIMRDLRIEDFRGLKRLELNNLGHVNLIVGANLCGKTAVLEAVRLLSSNGDVALVWDALSQRGEELPLEHEGGRGRRRFAARRQIDIRRLFHGHEIEIGKTFRISTGTDSGGLKLTAEIEEGLERKESNDTEASPNGSVEGSHEFSLVLKWSGDEKYALRIPVGRAGGVSWEALRRESRRTLGFAGPPLRFVNAATLTSERVSAWFERIELTPEEAVVAEALRMIEPRIERIASSGVERRRDGRRRVQGDRGGIFARLRGVNDRVPIGSLGDGVWRMLGLALAAVHSRDGMLLADEIDAGFHHSILGDLWRFLHECSKRYRFQIIATAHGRDCYQSLSAICGEHDFEASDVSISRLERGREQAVSYSEREILAVADRDIEVR